MALKQTTRFLLKARSSREIHAAPKHSEARKLTANSYRSVRRKTGARGANLYAKATFGNNFRVSKGKGTHQGRLIKHKGGHESIVSKVKSYSK
jgi:hypothetical protein